MNTFLKVLLSLVLILTSTVVTVATQNPLAGLAVIIAVPTGFQWVTGLSLYDGGTAAYCVLVGIKRTACQTANPGGGRRLFLIAADQIEGEWPKRSLITEGELTAAPTMKTGGTAPTFVEVEVSDNSLKLDQGLKGAVGYQSYEQSLEVKVAGYGKGQVAAIEKLLNTEIVAAALLNDGQLAIVGTSINGLQFEITHTTGAKGGDRREWTMKAKQDGYMHGYLPLASTVTLPGVSMN